MQTLRDRQARQAWSEVRSRVQLLQGAPPTPSMGQVFRDGFMHASMLQMAVCAPGRGASTARASQVLVARLGEKVAATTAA